LVKGDDKNYVLGFFRDRFGILQSVFASYHLFRRGPTVWLLSKDERLVNLASLQVKSVGLPLLRWAKTHLKPTTAALQLFGVYADKNIVSLAQDQLQDLVEKKEIKGEFGISPGYVIIVTETIIIGCGLYFPGRLISQFPRHLFTEQTWEYLPEGKRDEGIEGLRNCKME
jgi:NOL1/NOP2/fmu family ribosome biogenesis protein